MKNNSTTMILASIGALGGLYYAFKNKKSFLGYAGFFVLGSIAGHLAGNVVTAVYPQQKSNSTDENIKPVTTEEGKGNVIPPKVTGVDINNDPVMLKPKS